MSDIEQWDHDEQRAMENEIISLREHIVALTKEREAYCEKWHAELAKHDATGELIAANLKIAALAEQNEKYRKVIPHCVVGASGYAVEQLFIECLSLPDLATPVLNRIKAEAYREAAEIVENIDVYTFVHGGSSYDDGGLTLSSAATAIRAKADELEQIK